MGNNETDKTNDSHNVDENDDLDELMLKQLHRQRRPVHRRDDGYERKHIYRGAVVKQEKNNDTGSGSNK
ncbi:MAG TPA: hypothetical protein C5S50_06260 [Methanosarcinaceae archaeon]|nr:hypothetical protein [Methanosarcinaceae archaeon]